MPIEVRDVRALEGPNLYYGQPAVKLQTWSDRDIRRELSNAIKQWAQVTGTVIGYLRQDSVEADGGHLLTSTFTTPFPTVGQRIAEGAVADLQAAESGDRDYSHDDLLFEVMQLRKREEPSIELLQIYAEARARDLPFLARADGTIMVGSGARGFIFDPSGLSLGLPVEIPWDTVGRIPIVAVTGTNGKTTTVRLCAHVLRHTGKRVGYTDTDGIVVDGKTVETGDWAGFGGARRVLGDPDVDVAVLETSRGGILRRGLGFDYCDVSVITNVTADHLGELGVDSLEELARVKGVVALVTRADGRAVLNADDPQVVGLAEYVGAPIMWFTRVPDAPAIAAHRAAGGAGVWSDGVNVTVAYEDRTFRFPLDQVPIVVGGAAAHNVENVLAATAACTALGVEPPAIAEALRTFLPSDRDNSGRLNLFQADGITAVLDYAHNTAGMAALLGFGRSMLRDRTGRLIVVLGGPGDRLDGHIREQGRIAADGAAWLLLYEAERYLRGRTLGETTRLYREGAREGGIAPEHILDSGDELTAVDHALAIARPGDVILVAAHAKREAILARLKAWSGERLV